MSGIREQHVSIMADVTGHGGVSIYIGQLARIGRPDGWSIDVLLDDGRGADPVHRYLECRGLDVRRIPLRSDRNPLTVVELALIGALDRRPPQLVHAVLGSPRSLLLPRQICLSRGIPLVTTESYVAQDLVIPEDVRQRIREINSATFAIIFVSRENKELAHTKFGFNSPRAVVICNAVDLDKPRARRDREGRKIVCVARLTRQKGVDILLAALATLTTPATHTTIIGDGELSDELTRLAAQLALGRDTVCFSGWRDDVAEHLAAADLFVLPSRSEGLPFALLEALAAGLPCIASAVSGVPEALGDNHYGDLVAPDDPTSLAAAIDSFFRDQTRLWRKADRSRDYLKSQFDLAANLLHIGRIWRSAAASRTPG